MTQPLTDSATWKDLTNVVSGLCFCGGSAFFLPQFSAYAEQGVWLFLSGSVLWTITSALALKRQS